MKVKLLTQDMKTRKGCGNETDWSDVGEWHEAKGEELKLCTDGAIHFYGDPWLAVMTNPLHADISDPVMYKVETRGRTVTDGLKSGAKKLRVVRKVRIPNISIVQKIAFGILSSMEVYHDPNFCAWGEKWLSGEDRSYLSARAASDAAEVSACAAAEASHAASDAAEAYPDAAREAAAYAAADAAYAEAAAAEVARAAAFAAAEASHAAGYAAADAARAAAAAARAEAAAVEAARAADVAAHAEAEAAPSAEAAAADAALAAEAAAVEAARAADVAAHAEAEAAPSAEAAAADAARAAAHAAESHAAIEKKIDWKRIVRRVKKVR